MKTKLIAAGEFKTHCLQLIDQVNNREIELIITKRGKPLAKLIPVTISTPSVFGCLKDTAVISGDLVEPTGESWDADEV